MSMDGRLHNLDIQALLDKYKVFLHGNPYKSRKVVLDQNIYDVAQRSRCPLIREQDDPPRRTLEETSLNFKDKLCQRLKNEALIAKKNKESLLVMVFAHGQEDGKAHIGNDILGIKEFMRNLQQGPGKLEVQTTLVSTACYSGRWLMNRSLTGLTAAGVNRSQSWHRTASSGRYPGSMFTSALIGTLVQKNGSDMPLDPDDNDEVDRDSQHRETYSKLTENVYQTLLKQVDRYGVMHHVSFSAPPLVPKPKRVTKIVPSRTRTSCPRPVSRNASDQEGQSMVLRI